MIINFNDEVMTFPFFSTNENTEMIFPKIYLITIYSLISVNEKYCYNTIK